MNAVGTLLRLRWRRDRVQVPVWVVVIALTCLLIAVDIADTFNTQALRIAAVQTFASNPTLLALRGAPDGASAGAFFWVEIGSYLALLVAFMNSFLAVRHTRADEEAGRAELIVATRAGRGSSTIATVLLAVIANVGVAVLSGLAMMAAGFDAAGSFALGWALGTTGIVFFGIGLLFAQIFSTSRAANGWGTAAIGVAWVLNAAGAATGTASPDGLHVTPGAAAWFTPIGWATSARPFTADLLWPGLLSIGLAIVLVVLALVLQRVRDTGSGLVAARAGRAVASSSLAGPIGLAWRLQRGSIIGWGIGAVLGAGLVGGLGKTLETAAKDSPQLGKLVDSVGNGSGTILEVFLGVMMTLIGLLVAGAAIQTMMRLRQEEAAGTAEIVLVTRVSRLRWYLSYVVVAIVAAAVILIIAGVVAGATLSNIDGALFGQAIVLAVAQLPAVAVFLAIAALAFALVPAATIPVGWAIFGVGVVLGEFGNLFGFPDWVIQIAPNSHTVSAPLAGADWSGTWVLSAIAVIVVAAAAWLFRIRDLRTG